MKTRHRGQDGTWGDERVVEGGSVSQLPKQSRPVASTPDRLGQPAAPPTRVTGGWRRLVMLAVASFFFCLGLLGVALPGIPATPFLLLTSYFLVRSSPRLNARLLNSRVFGPILVDWQVHGGVRTHVRCKAIAAVAAAVAITIYLSGFSVPATATVIVLASIGIAVILKLPAARQR